MTCAKDYIKSLFRNCSKIDSDLKKILHKLLNDKYALSVKIKNVKFAETASHTMFFNTKKQNSLSNAPLNAKFFSKLNKSNISISLATAKIKLNNPSSPLYLDFFGNIIRTLPNKKYKESFVYCLNKFVPEQIDSYKKLMDLSYKQYIVGNLNKLKGLALLKNNGCISNHNFLDKKIHDNLSEASLIKKKIHFKRGIYEKMLNDMTYSYSNNCHKNLSDQVNYVQSNIINNVFLSKNKHYYLSLEEIASALFIRKVSRQGSFLNKLFGEKKLRSKIYKFFDEPLFLEKEGLFLIPVDNKLISELPNISNFIIRLEQGNIILNVKFSLFILSFYGLQTFGGRFQKKYMLDFVKNIERLVKEVFSEDRYSKKSYLDKIKKIKFFDIASLILAKKDKKTFCHYDTLLSGEYNLDKSFYKILSQNIKVAFNNTEKYFEEKKYENESNSRNKS
jgi:hypothetical protein